MNERIEKEKQVKKFCAKFVLFSSLTDDLVFFVIIDTLFLTIVKGLSASYMTLLSAIPATIGIVIQPYILKFIHKIGNTKAIRIGAFSFLLASLLITVGNQFIVLVVGKIFYEISYIFKNMENICLKHNLQLINKEEEYVHVKNKAMTSYALITLVTAITSGLLFNINVYLPMILNCVVCLGCLILSFGMKDMTKYDKIPPTPKETTKQKNSLVIYITILTYTFFGIVVNIGQANGKLLIQYELNDAFELTIATTYFSIIMMFSRIARILSNVLFDKIYRKLRDKITMVSSGLLVFAFLSIIFGYFILENTALRVGMMVAGFFVILAVRDPFKVYIQDLVLRLTRTRTATSGFS